MHKLTRQIRFSINPFLPDDDDGFNSYSSKPAGEGLAIYLSLWLELRAKVDRQTGFVVNVVEIDKIVRSLVVPVFRQRIKTSFGKSEHLGYDKLNQLLRESWKLLENKFENASTNSLALEVNPFRKITIRSKEQKLISLSEKFEFAATHRLWNEDFSPEKNLEVFGKCSNPQGHGHNYIVEVTAKGASQGQFDLGNFQKTINEKFISLVDHKNLNVDVEHFSTTIPTVENITTFAWQSLADSLKPANLESITIWESDRMYCTYSGPEKG